MIELHPRVGADEHTLFFVCNSVSQSKLRDIGTLRPKSNFSKICPEVSGRIHEPEER